MQYYIITFKSTPKIGNERTASIVITPTLKHAHSVRMDSDIIRMVFSLALMLLSLHRFQTNLCMYGHL